MKVSLVICTFNRCALLEITLHSVIQEAQTCSEYVEIIVIDNNSDDNTAILVNKIISENPSVNIKYYKEHKQGLSNARNKGIEMAQFDIVTFIDDDVILDKFFFQEIIAIFTSCENYNIIGGKVSLKYLYTKPSWLDDNLELYLSKLHYKTDLLELDFKVNHIVGANMSFRSVAIGNSRFDPNLGRLGNLLISGEEIAFCSILINKGYKIHYSAKISLQHLVTKDRLNYRFFIRRFFYGGLSIGKTPKIKLTSMLKKLFKHLALFFFRIFSQNSFYYFLIVLEDLGILIGFCRKEVDE